MTHTITKSESNRISLILRKSRLDQSEMEFVVERYIYIRKGKDINIDLEKNSSWTLPRQLTKLNEAYDSALGWLTNNTNEWVVN